MTKTSRSTVAVGSGSPEVVEARLREQPRGGISFGEFFLVAQIQHLGFVARCPPVQVALRGKYRRLLERLRPDVVPRAPLRDGGDTLDHVGQCDV